MLTEGVVVDRKLGGPLGLISPNDAVVELGKEARLGRCEHPPKLPSEFLPAHVHCTPDEALIDEGGELEMLGASALRFVIVRWAAPNQLTV